MASFADQSNKVAAKFSPLQNWETIIGARKRFVYYTGIVGGNPSGSTDNIQFIFFESKKNSTGDKFNVTLVQELTYDAADNILTIEAIS